MMGYCKMLVFLITLSSIILNPNVNCMEFEVGGENGWTIPKKDGDMYNDWASQHRFNVNDSVHFKYKKDSVMAVNEEEYKKCTSVHPLFFSNNGDTEFKLERPGLFYFMSGVSGHCLRGQKLIVKVLEPKLNHSHTPNQEYQPNVAFLFPPFSSNIFLLLIIITALIIN